MRAGRRLSPPWRADSTEARRVRREAKAKRPGGRVGRWSPGESWLLGVVAWCWSSRAVRGSSEAAAEPAVGRAGRGHEAESPDASRAAERLDIQTAPVRGGRRGRRVVPYAALIYDEHGATWVYTSPKPLSFVRDPVEVERIEETGPSFRGSTGGSRS